MRSIILSLLLFAVLSGCASPTVMQQQIDSLKYRVTKLEEANTPIDVSEVEPLKKVNKHGH